MFGNVKTGHLATYLAKIDALFPEFRSGDRIDTDAIERYYDQSYWGYAIFHSWAGAIHMALSPSGRFSKNDYFRQVEEIEELVRGGRPGPAFHILEVGCGRGFNLRYLAECFPDMRITGVDVSARHVTAAREHLKRSLNARVLTDDFHVLSSVEGGSVDIAFAVETLCHTMDLERALESMSRVIRKGGQLVVFDGFRNPAGGESEQLVRAARYTERAMAVPEFRPVEEFVAAAEHHGLTCLAVEDRSSEIMPNLIRLSDLAKAYFKVRPVSKAILKVVPRGLVANAVAGLLMAVTVENGLHKYMKLHFRKIE